MADGPALFALSMIIWDDCLFLEKSPRRPLWVINLSLASEGGGGDICDKREGGRYGASDEKREGIGLVEGIRFEVCLPPSDQRERLPSSFPLILTLAH